MLHAKLRLFSDHDNVWPQTRNFKRQLAVFGGQGTVANLVGFLTWQHHKSTRVSIRYFGFDLEQNTIVANFCLLPVATGSSVKNQ